MLKRNRGFTLIELLVVIAIIAVLAAILFPVFMQSKKQATKAACLSNMSQIGKGLMMYVQNYNDRVPILGWGVREGGRFGFDPLNKGESWQMWFDQVLPYVKNVQVFACPARPKEGIGAYRSKQAFGYAMVASYEGADNWRHTAYSISQTKRPSTKVLVTEGYREWAVGSSTALFTDIIDHVQTAHGISTNYIFCDGHAKSMALKDTIVPRLLWTKMGIYPIYIDKWLYSEKEAQDYVLSKIE